MSIILASASPRRKELLNIITDDFKVMVSDCEESIQDNDSTASTVMNLSKLKAENVAQKCTENDTVIGADTVVELNGKILGKPKDVQDAFFMLQSLSGNTHNVYTGVTIIHHQKIVTFYECSQVTFFELSDDEIRRYISTGEPMDKAGAYGIQAKGALLVKSVNGDYFNVVGLPISSLYRNLLKLKVL